MKRSDADAGHVLWTNLHLCQEAIHQIDGGEENIVGQVVPDFEASQDVRGTITSAYCYFTILRAKNKKQPLDKIKKCYWHLGLESGRLDIAIGRHMPTQKQKQNNSNQHQTFSGQTHI